MLKKGFLFLIIFFVFACSEREEGSYRAQHIRDTESDIRVDLPFVNGDRIGVYPVGYDNGQPGVPGDIAFPINVPLYFDGATNAWRIYVGDGTAITENSLGQNYAESVRLMGDN